ncbi:DNA integration/recombination/inversion protein [Granulibacter bethesdensis]|uniref:DNA integration/recombination/inversion protein n=1 Tax=Granulibacter bethesdensis TaxID=364410 RepID=A0AAC9K823_9PROT|nr:recombinase family protein [Granulibacter bethesdensis]APH54895.1 DNA integration/recombination/inversion protein [Granulibacter bethesdensis]APH62481.1 DNA integration/recombination/inversion protein [Granulibacter bethesdensis]
MIEKKLTGRKIGYARVSTIGQTLDVQIAQLTAFSCHRIFMEKASGADASREELHRMLRFLRSGDTVVVTRIDRLARSTFDLFAMVREITRKGAQFLSLAEPWADTSTSTGRLMLAVLGGLADVERDLIRIRTAEGRARSVALGIRMGRPPKLSEEQKVDIRRRRQAGESLRRLAEEYCVSVSSISRVAA